MEEWTYGEWKERIRTEELAAFYLYTPLCGTCAVASKILAVVTELKPDLVIGKADMNYTGELAEDYQIESVPCLLIQRSGQPAEKVYAFKSVQNILGKLG